MDPSSPSQRTLAPLNSYEASPARSNSLKPKLLAPLGSSTEAPLPRAPSGALPPLQGAPAPGSMSRFINGEGQELPAPPLMPAPGALKPLGAPVGASSWGAPAVDTSLDNIVSKSLGPTMDPLRAAPERPATAGAQEAGTSYARPSSGPVAKSKTAPADELRTLVVTWNMASKAAPESLDEMLGWTGAGGPPEVGCYDIIVVGVQEAHQPLGKWEKKLSEGMRNSKHGSFRLLKTVRLENGDWIHMAVFVKATLLPFISGVQSDSLSTGIGSIIGNKGGVGITFSVEGTTFAFVNSHFQAHQGNINARNKDFMRISKLFSDTKRPQGEGDEAVSLMDGFDFHEHYDVSVWLGDLNYRIESNREAVDILLTDTSEGMQVLRANDQLVREMEKGNCFQGFSEGPLSFAPTYKFDKNSDVYDSSPKQRIPSWTDRILYKVKDNDKPKLQCQLKAYGSVTEIKSSDHRPVAAHFVMKLLDKKEKPHVPLIGGQGGAKTCSIQ